MLASDELSSSYIADTHTYMPGATWKLSNFILFKSYTSLITSSPNLIYDYNIVPLQTKM